MKNKYYVLDENSNEVLGEFSNYQEVKKFIKSLDKKIYVVVEGVKNKEEE